ncbi:MAG: TonB family protein [Prolixibacteraceae bacterium]
MNNAVNFLLESGVSLALLSLIYILFLRNETYFRFNRVFLLISVAFSVLLPFLHFKVLGPQSVMLPEVTVTPYRNLLETVVVFGQDFSGAVENTVSSNLIIISVYLVGVAFFLVRFIFRLIQIFLLVKRNSVHKNGTIKFVALSKSYSPFSFLNYVFINPDKEKEAGFDKMVAHEMEHIRQGHTFDVLILEIMTIFQWFNPFLWILKRVIRENHEFLADHAVLNAGVSRAQYKQLLLNQVVGSQLVMTNNFNTSLIKNRIQMISKIKSSKLARFKYLVAFIPVIALVVFFACEKNEQSEFDDLRSLKNYNGINITFSGDTVILKVDKPVKSSDMENLRAILRDTKVKHIRYISSKTDLKDAGIRERANVLTDKPVSTLNGEPVFVKVEQMPEFPGGEMALRKYIATTVEYPVEARDNSISGKVYVTFVVSKDGSVANAEIARGVDPLLDKEALRVIKNMTDWQPGYQRGEPVNVKYTVPIDFALQ